MVTDVVMPRHSLTRQKGTVIKWLKNEGETVEKGTPIIEVEADNVTTQIESPVSSVLLRICAPEQTEVPVGNTLAFIGRLGEVIPETEEIGEEAVPIEESVGPTSITQSERRGKRTENVRSSPLARRLAKQREIELAEMKGTGPRRRVTREDFFGLIDRSKEGCRSSCAVQQISD